MLTLLPHLIWAGIVMYLAHEVRDMLKLWMEVVVPSTTTDPVEVPDDLLALANQEREVWAQEETLRAIRERYEVLKNWNKVRFAFGVGRIDG